MSAPSSQQQDKGHPVIYWLINRLLQRGRLTPPLAEDAICVRCGQPADEQWLPTVCALREAGVKLDWLPVCAECDLALNEHTVRYFYGNKFDAELTAYREQRLA